MRVKARWEALDEESIQMAHARACGKIYHAPVFENGDSRKQLLARSIYLLYKKESLWTESQRARVEILFREYPDIKKVCKHSDKCTFYTLRFDCSFAAANTIKPQLL